MDKPAPARPDVAPPEADQTKADQTGADQTGADNTDAETFEKPAYWTDETAPEPEAAVPQPDPDGLSPTRYGDWVNKGIAIDF